MMDLSEIRCENDMNVTPWWILARCEDDRKQPAYSSGIKKSEVFCTEFVSG
jgi:hypothetical protein